MPSPGASGDMPYFVGGRCADGSESGETDLDCRLIGAAAQLAKRHNAVSRVIRIPHNRGSLMDVDQCCRTALDRDRLALPESLLPRSQALHRRDRSQSRRISFAVLAVAGSVPLDPQMAREGEESSPYAGGAADGRTDLAQAAASSRTRTVTPHVPHAGSRGNPTHRPVVAYDAPCRRAITTYL
jgi:hypothetical protein